LVATEISPMPLLCGSTCGVTRPNPYCEYGELVVAVDCALAWKTIIASKKVTNSLVYLIIMLLYSCV
jgi:hypothetical protein